VTYLAIDGDVTISLIQYEGGSSVPGTGVGFVPTPMAPVLPPPIPGNLPYPTNPTAYPTVPGAMPYNAPPPVPGGYAYQPGYGQGYPPGNYPVSHEHVLEFCKVICVYIIVFQLMSSLLKEQNYQILCGLVVSTRTLYLGSPRFKSCSRDKLF
jgi:hypothetical protein